jgi:hypothetical protein
VVAVAAAVTCAAVLLIAIGPQLRADPPPAGCDPGSTAPQFCATLPTLAAPASEPLPLFDQIQPCEAGGLRPTFCVGYPTAATPPDRPALLAQRQETCASLGREAPDFCLATSTDTSSGTLRREVTLGLLRQRLGSDFQRSGSGKAQLWTEVGVPAAVAERIHRTILEDAAAVEAFFGRTYREPPAVFLFSSQRSFGTALERQLGLPASTAALMSRQLLGVFLTGTDAVAINGEGALDRDRPVVYRHELAHVLIHQLAGDDVPAWLDEGLATYVSDFDASAIDPERAVALSLLRIDPQASRIFVDGQGFVRINTEYAGHAYAAAAEAVHLLHARVGSFGITALLESLGRSTRFSEAFALEVGEPFDAFIAGLPAAAWGGCRHGALISAPSPSGSTVFRLFGFTPNRTITVHIEGPGRYAFSVEPDRFGVYAGTLGPPMPSGTYTLSASGADGAVTAELTIGDPTAERVQTCQ